MIRFVSPSDGPCPALLDQGDPLMSALLHTEWTVAQRYPALDSRFWICLDTNDRPAAVLNGRPGGFFLLCSPSRLSDEMAGELNIFLNLNGCRHLLCAPFPLPGCTQGAPILRADSGAADPRVRRVEDGFRPVYALLGEEMEQYDEWLSGVRVRSADGFCAVYALYQDEIPVAAAMFTGTNRQYAVIGGVAVHPQYRRQGLGSVIVRHLTDLAARTGRSGVVACADESLVRFYEPLGFLPCGRWASRQAAE